MIKVIATNKKAFHDYFIEEKYEAGIELVGSEVKSVRLGNVNLKDSFAIIKGGEIFLINAHIAPYNKGSYFNPQSKRDRRLLLHKQEINRLRGRVEKKRLYACSHKNIFQRQSGKSRAGGSQRKRIA